MAKKHYYAYNTVAWYHTDRFGRVSIIGDVSRYDGYGVVKFESESERDLWVLSDARGGNYRVACSAKFARHEKVFDSPAALAAEKQIFEDEFCDE